MVFVAVVDVFSFFLSTILKIYRAKYGTTREVGWSSRSTNADTRFFLFSLPFKMVVSVWCGASSYIILSKLTALVSDLLVRLSVDTLKSVTIIYHQLLLLWTLRSSKSIPSQSNVRNNFSCVKHSESCHMCNLVLFWIHADKSHAFSITLRIAHLPPHVHIQIQDAINNKIPLN